MKKIIIALAMSLSACATIPNSPSTIANTTMADEKIASAVELEYKTFRVAVEAGVSSGLVKPGSAKAIKLADLDNKLYSAVVLVRSAYAAGNASNYVSAFMEANTLLTTGYSLLKGK